MLLAETAFGVFCCNRRATNKTNRINSTMRTSTEAVGRKAENFFPFAATLFVAGPLVARAAHLGFVSCLLSGVKVSFISGRLTKSELFGLKY